MWGTGIYTDDSNIARAAVHAGVIAVGVTDYVYVKVLPGKSSYTSTTQNGISSRSYGRYQGSYSFVDNKKHLETIPVFLSQEGLKIFEKLGPRLRGLLGKDDRENYESQNKKFDMGDPEKPGKFPPPSPLICFYFYLFSEFPVYYRHPRIRPSTGYFTPEYLYRGALWYMKDTLKIPQSSKPSEPSHPLHAVTSENYGHPIPSNLHCQLSQLVEGSTKKDCPGYDCNGEKRPEKPKKEHDCGVFYVVPDSDYKKEIIPSTEKYWWSSPVERLSTGWTKDFGLQFYDHAKRYPYGHLAWQLYDRKEESQEGQEAGSESMDSTDSKSHSASIAIEGCPRTNFYSTLDMPGDDLSQSSLTPSPSNPSPMSPHSFPSSGQSSLSSPQSSTPQHQASVIKQWVRMDNEDIQDVWYRV